jgi:hypothetical protein
MSICLRRREFMAALGGTAAWPLAGGAQQGGRVRPASVNSVRGQPWEARWHTAS